MDTRRTKRAKIGSLDKVQSTSASVASPAAQSPAAQSASASLSRSSASRSSSRSLSRSSSSSLSNASLSSSLSNASLSSSNASHRSTKRTKRKTDAANKIINFFKQTQHTRKARYLELLCSDAGVCLAFGRYTEAIKKHFGGYTGFDYVVPPIKRIGTPSENGFINEIAYNHRGYTSYAILKSAKTPDADNLLYEYIVGQYINRLNKEYPCFLETYGCYQYQKDKYWTRLQKDKPVTDIRILKKGLKLFKAVDYASACKASQQISILIQHLKNIQALGSLSRMPDFIENELMWVLFQLYIPLGKLKNTFTHYDLHLHNIYLYEPVPGKYIQYHYFLTKTNKISFKSKYMLKIIDYGRSYFKDVRSGLESKQVYADICAEDECNEPADERGHCGSRVGFGWLENIGRKAAERFYICAQKKNVSHDLLPLARIRENNTAPHTNRLTPDLNELVNQVVYLDDFGTRERPETPAPGYILNVGDAGKRIAEYVASENYQRQNENVYAGQTNLGDLFVYMNGKPMDFRPA
jgi:hypothetical protein